MLISQDFGDPDEIRSDEKETLEAELDQLALGPADGSEVEVVVADPAPIESLPADVAMESAQAGAEVETDTTAPEITQSNVVSEANNDEVAKSSLPQPERRPDLTVLRLVEKADKSAGKLVNLLAKHFPSFRDEARFLSKRVRLLKRPQIFVADLWAAFNGAGYGEFTDIDHLTMFAGKRLITNQNHIQMRSFPLTRTQQPQTTASHKCSAHSACSSTARRYTTTSAA